ncbi:S8 family serine peptidase [Kitasatospora sp. NPDC001664]
MKISRLGRGTALLAVGSLMWSMGTGPAAADTIREAQWAIDRYKAATEVWPISEGADVTVAVIDTGVLGDHQDLTGQVLPGADFSGEQSDGRVDKLGHGTSIASLIAAHGHGDAAGIIGLAPKAKILPVRIALDEAGAMPSGGEARFAEALRYAVDHGAKVVNMSITLGGLRLNAEARAAVNYAVSKDVVLVSGSGNLGGQDAPVSYPAAFPGVVAVGAVDRQGTVWNKSNRGPELTLVAPGVEVYSATSKSTTSYGNGTGTSAATAYVSAIAALVRSKYPQLSAGQVINRMTKSAVASQGQKIPNENFGYGVASPSKALAANPEVDNGPRDNPLLSRVESQGGPQASSPASAPATGGAKEGQTAAPVGEKKDDGGIPVFVWGVVGVLAVVVVGGVIVLARRRGGGGGGGQPPQPPYGGGQQYPQQYPPQQQYQQYPQPPQPGQGYPPPPPPQQGGGGNPYR